VNERGETRIPDLLRVQLVFEEARNERKRERERENPRERESLTYLGKSEKKNREKEREREAYVQLSVHPSCRAEDSTPMSKK